MLGSKHALACLEMASRNLTWGEKMAVNVALEFNTRWGRICGFVAGAAVSSLLWWLL